MRYYLIILLSSFSFCLACGGSSSSTDSKKDGPNQNQQPNAIGELAKTETETKTETEASTEETSTPPALSPESPLNMDEGKAEIEAEPVGEFPSDHGQYFASLNWLQGPTFGAYSRAELIIGNAEQKAASTVTDLQVLPWMKIHGHGSGKMQPTLRLKDPAQPHIFIIENIYFVMSGPWELRISATVEGISDSMEVGVVVP